MEESECIFNHGYIESQVPKIIKLMNNLHSNSNSMLYIQNPVSNWVVMKSKMINDKNRHFNTHIQPSKNAMVRTSNASVYAMSHSMEKSIGYAYSSEILLISAVPFGANVTCSTPMPSVTAAEIPNIFFRRIRLSRSISV